jgi:polar amino acid transport system permease protein
LPYRFHFGEVLANSDLLLRGIVWTVELWVISFVFAMVAGLFVGIARGSRRRWLNWPATAYIEFFRNIPLLVQLIWFYYAFPILSGIKLSPFVAATLGFSLGSSAYCAELYRAGLQSIARGQWEGANALGMTYWQAMRRIILPQAVRRMIPAFTNRAVELAKSTSIASILEVPELMYQARELSMSTFLPLETFAVVACIYFLLIYPGTWAASVLEQRLAARGA